MLTTPHKRTKLKLQHVKNSNKILDYENDWKCRGALGSLSNIAMAGALFHWLYIVRPRGKGDDAYAKVELMAGSGNNSSD